MSLSRNGADSAARITPRTKAIVVTRPWGIPAEVTALTRPDDEHGPHLFEDAFHAHGVSVAGRKVGPFGLAAAYPWCRVSIPGSPGSRRCSRLAGRPPASRG